MAANSQVLLGLYAAIYVRSPDKAGYDFWMGGFNAVPPTLTTRGAATAFSARTEWATAYPSTLSDSAYVDKIYLNVLGIAGDANGRKFWTDLITAKTVTRTDFVADFVAATLDYNSTTDTTSTAAEKASAVGAQTTIKSKVSFSETWVANTTVSSNSTITGVDSTGGYIASVDKSVALLAGVSDAATLATQTPKISAAAAAGTAFTLTTGTDTFTALTALNDTVTGGSATLGGDVIIDNTSTDADVLTATGVVATTKPTITKVETINVSNSFNTGLDLSSVSGATTLNLAVDVAGGSGTVTNAKLGAAATIVAGTNVGTLTVEAASTGTGGDVAITTGSAATLNLKGSSNSDNFALTTTGNIVIKSTTAASVETLKLTANPVAVTGTATPTAPVITLDPAAALLKASTDTATTLATDGGTLTVTSTGDLEIKAGIADLTGRTVTKGAGKLTVTLDTPSAAATFYNLKGIIADTISLNADFGATATISANDNATLATPTSQSLKLANATQLNINNTAATQNSLASSTIKSLTINSAAPAITGVDATYTTLDLSAAVVAPATVGSISATKVSFTGGTAAAGTTAAVAQDVKVASGKVETVDASKLVGTLDYTHAGLAGLAAAPTATDVTEKFTITGTAGADKVAFTTGNALNAKAALVATLGDGDDTYTLPVTTFGAGSTINIDGGAGTADSLVMKAGTDISAATLTLANVESIAFDTTGKDITFSALQTSGMTYSIKGSTAVDDNFVVKSVGGTTTVDLSKLVFDSAVEKVTINGKDGTGAQTLTGVASTSIGIKNVIWGGTNADTITGGVSADTIVGGKGADKLTGGLPTASGQDTFQFTTGDSTATAYDTITDFKVADADKVSIVDAAGLAVTVKNIATATTSTTTTAPVKAAVDPNSIATFTGLTDQTFAGHVTAVTNALALNEGAVWQEGADTFLLVKGATTADDIVVKVGAVGSVKLADVVSGVTAVNTAPTSGNDIITGTAGVDTTTQLSNSTAYGLNGQAGDDKIYGLEGNDIMEGGLGNDTLDGGAGDDTLDGDSASGATGADSLTGGLGKDTFNITAGVDTIADLGYGSASGTGTSDDVLNVTAGATANATLYANAGAVSWTPLAGTGISGTAVITAPAGTTTATIDMSAIVVGAGTGKVTIDASTATGITTIKSPLFGAASSGTASITGGAGADAITGGTGADTINGGAGNDNITGGVGADSITGGLGDDTIALGGATTGADKVIFSGATTALNGSDTITGYVVADDALAFTSLTTGSLANATVTTAITLATAAALATEGTSIPVANNKVYVAQTATTTDANINSATVLATALADTGILDAVDVAVNSTAFLILSVSDVATKSYVYGITNDATAAVTAAEISLVGTITTDSITYTTNSILFA